LIAAQSDIADFLQSQTGWFRVSFDEKAVPYNFGNLYGIEQFDGYLASMPERLQRVLGDPRTPVRYGVRYHVGNTPSDPAQVEVFRSRSGVKVFRDPRVGEPLSVYREEACDDADRLRVVSRAPGASVFEAELACPGLVVTGDPYYRGWRASVDGQRAPIQEFEGGTRAVRLTAGMHRIEFLYKPSSVYVGATVTLLGLLLATGLRVSRV
jgi:hypothetical protein